MGGFADIFGEDFLGLRELGIAPELGVLVSRLSVPKKLLWRNGHRKLFTVRGTTTHALPTRPLIYAASCVMQKQANGTSATLPTSPSISSTRVYEDGSGLLRPSYKPRFDTPAVSGYHPHTPTPTANGVVAVGDPWHPDQRHPS